MMSSRPRSRYAEDCSPTLVPCRERLARSASDTKSSKICTSVDHGTAFDIAGKAITDSRSMVQALHQAAEIATRPSVAV
ncbi:4-hydroxythreonine-4-phosphate dehydrogenase PdxA [Arthrobacter sp. OY3WO11]|uniref:4-hydroxythreonine-4-phosphate dehydrogenase PdxA n=1 Tax=Arthrobacter sp. OY3WO11 TaxID=1835723 RepID=UPI00336A1D40